MTIHHFDEDVLVELLPAYALDACDPDEAEAIEDLLGRRPELAAEAARLADAAAWIGAAEAMEPPPRLRSAVFERVHAATPGDAAARLYAAEADRVAREFEELDAADYGLPTPNGLTARQLVVHIAAQETMLAQSVGRPVEDIDSLDVEERTARFVERYEHRPYADAVAVWRRAVDAVVAWAADPASQDASVEWLGLPMSRDDALVARSFENCVHRDDLRKVRGRPAEPPPGPEVHLMAELSMQTLPVALHLAGLVRPGRTARVVLTGDGGGEWTVPLELGATSASAAPEVTLTADVVDWCLLAAERIDPRDLVHDVDGDAELADELLVAASAFAVL
jgi:uncharacterized protein (TIGR03083 family)